MTLEVESAWGWVLDHGASINRSFSGEYIIRPEIFSISRPRFSSAASHIEDRDGHPPVRVFVLEGTRDLITKARKKGLFGHTGALTMKRENQHNFINVRLLKEDEPNAQNVQSPVGACTSQWKNNESRANVACRPVSCTICSKETTEPLRSKTGNDTQALCPSDTNTTAISDLSTLVLKKEQTNKKQSDCSCGEAEFEDCTGRDVLVKEGSTNQTTEEGHLLKDSSIPDCEDLGEVGMPEKDIMTPLHERITISDSVRLMEQTETFEKKQNLETRSPLPLLFPCLLETGLVELCELWREAEALGASIQHSSPLQLCEGSKDETLLPSMVMGREVRNEKDHACHLLLLGRHYLIPPQSAFFLSDITGVSHLLQCGMFEQIVIDPPWENKSVKRSRRYRWLDPSSLLALPISSLAYPGALVAVWLTNQARLRRFILNHLLPAWKVRPFAFWLWVKVTTEGELISPLDSPHKRPYEQLVIGKRVDSSSDNCIWSKESQSEVPVEKLLLSTPSAVHSHKPPLFDVLAQYASTTSTQNPSRPRSLELFARSLTPGCLSWGNEAIKLQDVEFFKGPENCSLQC
uniref:N(6)-adenine-specific methyltransferase METTL4 isoform X2 n=1 Tax=Myxine glutinosa TaxID=7769 RepID=UPI00358E139A